MKNNVSSKTIIILSIVLLIMILIGGTFGYYSWRTSDAQKTNVTFKVEKSFSCGADASGGISSSGVNLIPTTPDGSSNPTKFIKREVKVMPKIDISGMKIYMDLWLTINNISDGLANSDNFKYAFTTSSSSPTTGVVTSGNFKNKTANEKILLFEEKEYVSTLTDIYYLWIWLDAAETSSATMNQSFNFSLGGTCTDKKPPTGADILIDKANSINITNYNDTNAKKNEMFTFSHGATQQTEALIDYRYIGNTPNNYITFNNETWRIIGVFDGMIKIIRNDSIGGIPWDNENINDWSNSSLQKKLNSGDYYNNINKISKNQIAETTYYLGGCDTYDISGETLYQKERGNNVIAGRPIKWYGRIGLIYPSDYIYTFSNNVNACFNNAGNCNNNPSDSWLHKEIYRWTIMPHSTTASKAYSVSSSGYIRNYHEINNAGKHVQPVLYLRSSIELTGSGKVDDPYQIVN